MISEILYSVQSTLQLARSEKVHNAARFGSEEVRREKL
jgi:hypothetical protein